MPKCARCSRAIPYGFTFCSECKAAKKREYNQRYYAGVDRARRMKKRRNKKKCNP